MMPAVLSLGLALLGGIICLAQTLRLSVPLLYGALVITVFRPWYLAHTALADGIQPIRHCSLQLFHLLPLISTRNVSIFRMAMCS